MSDYWYSICNFEKGGGTALKKVKKAFKCMRTYWVTRSDIFLVGKWNVEIVRCIAKYPSIL
jgi:hypothetical protein